MKNVISYSLWGSNPLYVNGAHRALDSAPRWFPGWTVRVYLDCSVPANTVDALALHGAEIVYKPDAPPGMGLYWRFEAMYDDSEIDRFMVRDFDCDFTQRELDAVNEWIESGLDFHIMRDNVVHDTPILGGLWGAKAGCIPDFKQRLSLWFQGFTPHSGDPRSPFYGSDQEFLGRYVWPIVQGRYMAHDDYEREGRYGERRPFPSPVIDGHYVGAVW